MSQLKSYLGRASRRLPRALASAGLLLSAAAGSAILMGGEAKALICYGPGPFAPPVPPPFSCTDGDFTMDWRSGPAPGVNMTMNNEINLNDIGVQLPIPGDTASVQVVWEPDEDYPASPTPSVYEYKITHNPGEFFGYSKLDPAGLMYDITKELSYDENFSTIFATLRADTDPLTPINETDQVFYPGQSNVLYSRVTINSATALNDIDDFHQTPGPLPILGAGTAFGLSRKLRSRIKAARAA